MNQIHAAYQEGNYAEASRQAQRMMRSGQVADREEAAYMAGMSAYRTKHIAAAEQRLRQAAKSRDSALSADALVMLGVIYSERGRYDMAAASFLNAARRLSPGQDRANAYFHAAKAQQKLGRWAQARTSLSLARASSDDGAFRDRVTQELTMTGFTLQAGAFTDQANALGAAETLAGQTIRLKLGRPRLVPAVDRNGRKLFLVQAGQFSSYHSALAARRQLGRTTAIVVPLTGAN